MSSSSSFLIAVVKTAFPGSRGPETVSSASVFTVFSSFGEELSELELELVLDDLLVEWLNLDLCSSRSFSSIMGTTMDRLAPPPPPYMAVDRGLALYGVKGSCTVSELMEVCRERTESRSPAETKELRAVLEENRFWELFSSVEDEEEEVEVVVVESWSGEVLF